MFIFSVDGIVARKSSSFTTHFNVLVPMWFFLRETSDMAKNWESPGGLHYFWWKKPWSDLFQSVCSKVALSQQGSNIQQKWNDSARWNDAVKKNHQSVSFALHSTTSDHRIVKACWQDWRGFVRAKSNVCVLKFRWMPAGSEQQAPADLVQ